MTDSLYFIVGFFSGMIVNAAIVLFVVLVAGVV